MALVTGILATRDPKEIEQLLTAANIDASKVRVINKAAPSQESDESIIDFISVAESQATNDFSDEMTHNTGIMSDSGGTSVPGIGGRGPSMAAFTHGGGLSYLAGFPIPGDSVGNLNDAVEEGRSIVMLTVEGDPTPVVAAFKAAGLRAVRTF